MSELFSPLTLGPLTLRNRIVVAPMCPDVAIKVWRSVKSTAKEND